MNHLRVIGATILLAVVVSLWAGQPGDLRKELDDAFQQGMALRQQGKFGQAVPFFEKAAALAPKVFGPDHINTGHIIGAAGSAHYSAGNMQKSEALLRRSLEIQEAIFPKTDARLLQILNNLSAAQDEVGKYDEAEKNIKRALAIQEARKPRDDLDISLTLNNYGVMLHRIARYDEAARVIKRCVELREGKLGKEHPDVADGLYNLADVYRVTRQDKEAEATARRCLDIRQKKFGPNHALVAQCLTQIGMIAWNSGRFEEAEKYYMQGLAIREKLFGKDDPGNASALNSLALLYNGTDRFGEAEILYRRALAMREERHGPNHPQVAIVLANLAQMCNTLGRHDEAEKMMLRCLKIHESRGPNHPEIAVALNNLAVMYQQQSRFKEALPLLERALTINETRFGKEHLEVSVVLNNLAMLHRHSKNPAEALVLLQRALKIQETHYGPNHSNSSITIMNIAMMHRRLGDFVKADEMIERAIKLVQAKKAEPHIVAEWLHQRAELSQAMNRTPDALKWNGQSMALHQTSLRNIFAFSSEASMHAFAATTTTKIPSLISLAAEARDDDAATQAFDWTLRLKGAVFDTICRYRQAQQMLPKDAVLQTRVARYRSQKEFLANLALTPPSAKDAERVKKQMADAEQDVAELEKELNQAVSGKVPELVARREGITARDVQGKLPAEGVLIEFMRTPIRDFKEMHWRHDRYFAFVLRPGKDAPKLIDLGPAKEIDAGVEALRKEFLDFQEKLAECETADEIKTLEKAQENPFKEKSAALHARLMGPLAKAIGDAKLLYVAADGALNRLPFECLVGADGKYLVERHRCAYLSSGRDLLRAPGKPAAGTVVFAGPDYKLDAAERLVQAEKLLNKTETMLAMRGVPGRDLRSAGFKPLPGAAAEAKDIQKILAKSDYGPVTAYVGAQALEDVLKAMPAPRVLHLATHGFFLDREAGTPESTGDDAGAGSARKRLKRMENPLLRSGIVLAGANTIGDKDGPAKVEDGWVTAEEIALLNLHGTELVVLSACQTGLGDIKTGEGVYGLRRAFLHAGARTLVTSLFEVPDSETRELMQRFYTGVSAGQGKLRALHGAQLGMIEARRQDRGAAHPFFWASFVLVGNAD